MNPREKDEGSCPSTPLTLTVSCLKSYNACRIRCGVHGFAMNPYYSLPVSTAPYYREARVTMAQRQTSCGRGIAALAARGMKQMLQFVGTYDTVITRRCTNGRRLATSPRGGGRYAYYDHVTYPWICGYDPYKKRKPPLGQVTVSHFESS